MGTDWLVFQMISFDWMVYREVSLIGDEISVFGLS
jgi:hypothetical protein